jgi:hypothetical protein
MGSFILRGITTALLVTVLTLFAGIVWGIMELGGLSISRLLDIGLLASCLVGGYRTAKESGMWLLGGIVGAGYVTVGTLLLALFLPVQGWGFIQVLAEGAIIGLVAGAVGAGGTKGTGMSVWSGKRSQFIPSYGGYETNEGVSSKFDWDKEEGLEEWKEAPITNWNEISEKSPDVQWSWDREEKETMISSASRHSEPLVVWEPDPVRIDGLGRNRASLNKISEDIARSSRPRPWWEE